jgi:hypothetical protein
MTKKSISKILQAIVILTFTLPFFYTGCGNDKASEKENAVKDSLEAVSLAKEERASLISDSFVKASNSEAVHQEKPERENADSTVAKGISTSKETIARQPHKSNKEEQLTDEIVADYPSLSLLLMPSKDTYSGFGTVINGIPFIVFFALSISMLLLIVGLLIKFIEPQALKTTVIIDAMILLGIWVSRSPSWNSERLWGFWVCLCLTGMLLVYDIYVLITRKR